MSVLSDRTTTSFVRWLRGLGTGTCALVPWVRTSRNEKINIPRKALNSSEFVPTQIVKTGGFIVRPGATVSN